MRSPDPRTRQRILAAAHAVTTRDERDAAIVGGIAHVMCLLGGWSNQAAVAAAAHAHGLLQGPGVDGDRYPIRTDELRSALDRWKVQYERVQVP